jgi:hypothetical protein
MICINLFYQKFNVKHYEQRERERERKKLISLISLNTTTLNTKQ